METKYKPNEVRWQKKTQLSNIKENEIYLFNINIDNVFLKIADDYENILSQEELIKARRFSNYNDSKRFVVGKYTLRNILSYLINISPEDILFSENGNKKPFVHGVEFNISHSDNLVLIGISDKPIGVDIEFKKKDFDFLSLLSDCFGDEEISTILKSTDQLNSFYKLWTRKEAILKATGEGLIDDLPNLNCLPGKISRGNLNFNLYSFIVDDNYLATVCFNALTQHINFYSY